ncbi:MAG: polyprenyl synthetase family protein [Psychrobacillus sp.]
MNCALEIVNNSFTENKIRNLAINYIHYKFKNPLNFAYLTDIHYRLFRKDYCEREKLELQAIIEIIILAADIMDDLQDGDSKFHPWSEVELGQNLNIIIGLLLASLSAVESIISNNQAKCFIRDYIYKLILKSIDGQQYDLINQIATEGEYIEMVSLKSGSLILLANIIGAGDVSKEQYQILERYSNYLGVVAQLRNDVNDLLNSSLKNDLRLKKKTLPIIYYLHIEDNKFSSIRNYYNSNNSYESLTHEYRKNLYETIVQGGALQYCKVIEQLYIHKFKECIYSLNLPPSTAKEQLLNIKI